MKALELIRRINRARAKGEDVSVLERELRSLETAEKPKAPPRSRKQRTIDAAPYSAALLRRLLKQAQRKGRSLGWVMHRFKDEHGQFPGRKLWNAVVGTDDRDQIIDSYIERIAMEARSTAF